MAEWEADFSTRPQRNAALADAIRSIETEIDRWSPDDRSVGELGQHIQAMLRWQLPHYYPNPEAQPGYRRSDDDFVGAFVIHVVANASTAESEQDYEARLFRDPKPKPKFTDMTLTATINFKNLP